MRGNQIGGARGDDGAVNASRNHYERGQSDSGLCLNDVLDAKDLLNQMFVRLVLALEVWWC